MLVVILIYDQLLFRPLVAWADRFRIDNEQSEEQPESWALNVYRRSRLLDLMATPFEQMMRWSYHWQPPSLRHCAPPPAKSTAVIADIIWYVLLRCSALYGALAHLRISSMPISAGAIWRRPSGWAFITMIRVMVLIALASLIWTPDRRLCGLAAPADRRSSSRWRSFWPPFPTTCCSRWSVFADRASGTPIPTSGCRR